MNHLEYNIVKGFETCSCHGLESSLGRADKGTRLGLIRERERERERRILGIRD
jgi:hypothetical protein